MVYTPNSRDFFTLVQSVDYRRVKKTSRDVFAKDIAERRWDDNHSGTQNNAAPPTPYPSRTRRRDIFNHTSSSTRTAGCLRLLADTADTKKKNVASRSTVSHMITYQNTEHHYVRKCKDHWCIIMKSKTSLIFTDVVLWNKLIIGGFCNFVKHVCATWLTFEEKSKNQPPARRLRRDATRRRMLPSRFCPSNDWVGAGQSYASGGRIPEGETEKKPRQSEVDWSAVDWRTALSYSLSNVVAHSSGVCV